MGTLPSTESIEKWAERWSELVTRMLIAQLDVQRGGDEPSDETMGELMRSGEFDGIVEDKMQEALSKDFDTFQLAVTQTLARLDEKGEPAAVDLLSDLMQSTAANGYWEQRVPLAGSRAGSLSGESMLFGLGVLVDGPLSSYRTTWNDSHQVEKLKAHLLSDFQLANAFRVVLLPMMLSAEQTGQMGEWHISRLRTALELWVSTNPVGHPTVIEAAQMLDAIGLVPMAPRVVDGDGRVMSALGLDGYVMSSYMVTGLLMHTPQDPLDLGPDDEQAAEDVSPLGETLLYPRSYAVEEMCRLETEQDHIRQVLADSTGRGHDNLVLSMRKAMVGCEVDMASLDCMFGRCLLPDEHPDAMPGGTAGDALQAFLATSLSIDDPVMAVVVASGDEYFEASKACASGHRYFAANAMLMEAAYRVHLQTPQGLLAQLTPDRERNQMVVHLRHPATGHYAGTMNWPFLSWEEPNAYLESLNDVLQDAGVVLSSDDSGSASGSLH